MKALSIRQPWAWLIVNGGKDLENRDWDTEFRGRVLVHVSKSGSKKDYAEAVEFARELGAPEPPAQEDIERGGIIGSIEIVDVVTSSDSPWFFGPFGFVLRDFRPMDFMPYKGALGLFDVPEVPE